MGRTREAKAEYFEKLRALIEKYRALQSHAGTLMRAASIFVVSVDNVGSNQMHQIRQSLRGEGVILMGKNTMYVERI